MNPNTHNTFMPRFLFAAVAGVVATNSAGASTAVADPQEQARAMLLGVSGRQALHDAAPSSGDVGATRPDPQIQAQRLLAGRPNARSGASAESTPRGETTSAVVATGVSTRIDAAAFARRILGGKGS